MLERIFATMAILLFFAALCLVCIGGIALR